MRTRRFTKGATGLVAIGAALGLLALPAAATPVPATLVSGTIQLYNSSDALVGSVGVGSSGSSVDCSASASTLEMTGGSTSGSFTAVIDSDSAVEVPAGSGQHFRVEITGTIAGSYGATTLNGNPASSSAIATLRPTTGSGSCTVVGSNDCTIEAYNLDVNGTHDVSPPPNVSSGDRATVSGGNLNGGDFDTFVYGNACGTIIGVDDGSINLVNVIVEAT